MKTLELKCRFCGANCGKVEFEDWRWERHHHGKPFTIEYLGLEETRCTNCVAKYGRKKDAFHLYDMTIRHKGKTIEDFENMFAQAEYKLDNFVENMVIEYPDEVLIYKLNYQIGRA